MSSAQSPRTGMPRLRDRLRITSLDLRDRCAMVCALGAVACLSSLIANWSRQFPVEHSSWEQSLFGDLENVDPQQTSAPAPREIESPPAEAPPPGEPAFHDTVHANEMKISGDAIRAVPIAHRPPEHRPRFIEPVNYQQRDETPSVWLSGAIEIESDDDAGSQPEFAQTAGNRPAFETQSSAADAGESLHIFPDSGSAP